MEHFINKIPFEKGSFTGHATFPLRQGWLWKSYSAVKDSHPDNSSLFSDEASIARFGVGKNMVSSIRHWALSCNVIREEGERYVTTQLGDFLFGPSGLDPYLENQASVWLFQWIIAGDGERCTTWYWAFNHYPNLAFDRDSLTESLLRLCASKEWRRPSPATIKRDVDCFIRSYVSRPHNDTDAGEEAAEPMLAELGLLRPAAGRSTFSFRHGSRPTLHDGVFNYALYDFWNNHSSADTLSHESICHEPGSPGRTFKLDADSVAERLAKIEDTSLGVFGWTDTAGLKQVIRKKKLRDPFRLLNASYQ